MPRVSKPKSDDAPFDFNLNGQIFSRVERFLEFWRSYPDRDGLKAYLYRVGNPWIDSRQSGKRESSLETWENQTGPGDVPTPDDILRKWGSGKFQFMLNDRKKPDNAQQMAKCTFTLDDADVPAVYNPSDLIVTGEQGEKNRPYIERWLSQGWSIVEGQTNEVYRRRSGDKGKEPFASLLPATAAAASAASSESETVNAAQLQEIVKQAGAPQSELVSGLLGLLTAERARQVDPLTQALQIVDKFKPAPDQNQVAVMQLLTDLLKDRMGNGSAAARAADPMEATRAQLGFLRELKDSGFLGSAEAKSGGGDMWAEAFKALPHVLDFLKQGFGAFMMARGMAAAGPGVAGMPAPGAAAPIATAAATAAPEFEGLPGMAPAPEETTEGDGSMFGMPKGVTIASMVDVGKKAIAAYRRGIPGADFAHGLCSLDEKTELLYGALHGAGRDQLLQLLDMAGPMAGPEISEVLQNERPKISAWLDSFLAYGDGAEDESETEGDGRAVA